MEYLRTGQERLAVCGWLHLPTQNFGEGHETAIEQPSLVLILSNRRAIQIDPGEKTAGARIGQNFRSHLDVSVRGSIPPNWPSSSGSISSKLELAGKQVLHTLIVGHDHDQIDGLATELQTPASPCDGDGSGSAPAQLGSTRGDPLAVISAEAHGDLHHGRDYGDALCIVHNLIRDGFVRGCHDLIQDFG